MTAAKQHKENWRHKQQQQLEEATTKQVARAADEPKILLPMTQIGEGGWQKMFWQLWTAPQMVRHHSEGVCETLNSVEYQAPPVMNRW